MSEPRTRAATVEDAEAIAAVHVQAWRETYAAYFTPEFLAGLDDVIKVEIWESIIRGRDADIVVAEVAGEIVGWAIANEGRDEDAPAARELGGIYVLRAHHGSGVGQRLLDTALGAGDAYLWVVEGNGRAEAFYRRNGFERDGGAKRTPLGNQSAPTVRMVRR